MKCPEDIGTSQYVIIYFDATTNSVRPCNIGIFSCYCTNYEAVARTDPIDGTSLDFVVLGEDYTVEALESVDPDTLVLSHSKTFIYPEITAHTECVTCSTRLIARYEESLEPYLDVAILQTSSTYFSITYTFELDTPEGEHQVNLVTQAYREGEDAVDLYTDTITCNVTAAQYDVAEEEEQETFVD